MLGGLSLTRAVPAHGRAVCFPPLETLMKLLPQPGGRPVATGHQPGFWHAGIAFKVWLASRLAHAASGAPAQFWIVDHEPLGDLSLRLPGLPKGPARNEIPMASSPALSGDLDAGVLRPWPGNFELPEPWSGDAALFGGFWDRARSGGGSAAAALARTNLDYWASKAGVKAGTSPVTGLSKDPAFLAFAHRILKDRQGFSIAFNEALAGVRKRHRVRHPALPLPDLGQGEAPFWARDREGKRRPLGPLEIPSDPAELEAFGLLPRASTLTLFLRLEKTGLFLHGLGGAAYEEVNDFFWSSYDGRVLAPYGAVSFTWIPGGDPGARRSEAARRLRRGRTNPEELATGGSAAWALAEEKRALLRSGIRGREHHKRLASINAEMIRLLSAEMEGLEREAAGAESALGLADREDPALFMGVEGLRIWGDFWENRSPAGEPNEGGSGHG